MMPRLASQVTETSRIQTLAGQLRPSQGGAAATALAEVVLAARGKEDEVLAELWAIAASRKQPAHLRLAALLAAVRAATMLSRPLPDSAIGVVEDPVLLEGALQLRLAAPFAAAVTACPTASSHLRRWIGRRLALAGERGAHVHGLLLDAGDDPAYAASLAAEDFVRSLLPRTAADPLVAAWCRGLLRWARVAGDAFLVPFAAELARIDRGAAQTLADWLVLAAGLEATKVATLLRSQA